ncbi:MAG: glycine cleavage system protein GcvH [Bacteroidota bacterium]|nr:glycine cleavage system protein GcvH [Bacteroidota bacterium]MDP4231684.1 glycine cleavage system protein GcvH [Bacteroidota bacterium]MDP4237342.1 glycine cleavage system protein GcvH [Bacteroidota bacterium]
MNFPENLTYTKEHEWLRVEGNTAILGITDFAQGELGDVIYLDIPTGKVAKAGESIGSVEAVKTVSDIYTPVSGTVIEVNSGLNDAPETVNKDPYGAGWLVKIDMSNPAEAKSNTMGVAEYKALIGQ